MRCKACDRVLSTEELMRKTPWGEPEELCSGCIAAICVSEYEISLKGEVELDGEVQENNPVPELWEQFWPGDL